jgi:hypothetical protein
MIGVVSLLILGSVSLWGQYNYVNDPASLVGVSLPDLIAMFGAPLSVHVTRGPNTWQDDVVFAYGDWEFYVYGNRVWQISLKAAYGIKIGDRRETIPLVLGNDIQVYDAFILQTYSNRSWPITIRFNIDQYGLVTAIFIYRPDL